MKYSPFLLLLLFALGSCEKNPTVPLIIVEPPEPVEIILDSLVQGSRYNVHIGDPAEKVYSDLQSFAQENDPTAYLAVTGFLNNSIADLKDRIPLYNSLLFDEKPSSKHGGQIYFENHKIKSIYNRDGQQLTSWPQGASNALRVGDPVENIYPKLVKLNADGRYTSLFQYIGMFEKNLGKPYDHFQERSLLWNFNFSIDSNQVMRLDLLFEDGRLVKLRSRYERYSPLP